MSTRNDRIFLAKDTINAVLNYGHLSDRDLARALSCSKTTIARYRQLSKQHGLNWSELQHEPHAIISKRYNRVPTVHLRKRQDDWAAVDRELKEDRDVTIALCWERYVEADPKNALKYPQYAANLRRYRLKHKINPHQHHKPGDRAESDFCGRRPFYWDASGKKIYVELFVGALPKSKLIFATAVRTQSASDFIDAHIQMLEFFGGVPHVITPDNLKAAVDEPGGLFAKGQRFFLDFARHYDLMLIPARVRRPKDKSTVEKSVGICRKRILAPLRKCRFESLEALNAAISIELEKINHRVMKTYQKSRWERFHEEEKAALRPLPPVPYEACEFIEVRKVPDTHHVCIKDHHYSVPHRLIGERVDARLTPTQVEILHQREVIATHPRSEEIGGFTSDLAHYTDEHRSWAQQNPDGVLAWARAQGGAIQTFIEHQFALASQPFKALPTSVRVMALGRTPEQLTVLEAACKRAVQLDTLTFSSLQRFFASGKQRDSIPPSSGTEPNVVSPTSE